MPALASPSCACLHCGAATASGAAFCCPGCRVVHERIEGWGLERFYRLRGASAAPAAQVSETLDGRLWLEPEQARVRAASGLCRVSLDVAGVHCAACVWLIERLFEREPGAARCVVIPGRGQLRLDVSSEFDLGAFAASLESVGYRLGPRARDVSTRSLTLRMGICLALAANTMMLSLAFYFGLAEGRFHSVARPLVFGLATAAVVIGGSHFAAAAWRGLQRGVLHLDLPIALGIGMAWVGSAIGYVSHDPRAEFFDSVTVFVALMLVGRWAQEQVVTRNRAALLASGGAEALFARRLRGGTPEYVRCPELQSGDRLLLAHGDLVPVDATLEAPARVRLDWIDGESAERSIEGGGVAPAGAFLSSRAAVCAEARTDFADSPLDALLAPSPERSEGRGVWDRVARVYVLGVLGLATLAVLLYASEPAEALRIATAVLVVTCPCAIGIAAPLAREWIYTRARRHGLFIRDGGVLERARDVRRVVFDKTGTLTTGRPTLSDRSPLDSLEPDERSALYQLAARSTHPKARAVVDALGACALEPGIVAHEEPSRGMQMQLAGSLYRLGEARWAAPTEATDADLVFAIDGRARACFETRETLREGAAEERAALERMGLSVYLSSGDRADRVAEVARRVGVPVGRAFAEQRPEDKARWLRSVGGAADTLFVGDGVNDVLAAAEARVSGTPAIDRPHLAARCDFYFTRPGLGAIRALLLEAARWRRIVRADLAIALAYNGVAVTLALLGWIEPWVAAVLMPLSSIATLGVNAVLLRGESPWTP